MVFVGELFTGLLVEVTRGDCPGLGSFVEVACCGYRVADRDDCGGKSDEADEGIPGRPSFGRLVLAFCEQDARVSAPRRGRREYTNSRLGLNDSMT